MQYPRETLAACSTMSHSSSRVLSPDLMFIQGASTYNIILALDNLQTRVRFVPPYIGLFYIMIQRVGQVDLNYQNIVIAQWHCIHFNDVGVIL